MKIQIEDDDLKELIDKGSNNRFKRLARNKKFMEALGQVYRIMEIVPDARGLKNYSFLHYEQLVQGAGKSSVRIMNGRVERLIFMETNNGQEINILELDESHYGKKK